MWNGATSFQSVWEEPPSVRAVQGRSSSFPLQPIISSQDRYIHRHGDPRFKLDTTTALKPGSNIRRGALADSEFGNLYRNRLIRSSDDRDFEPHTMANLGHFYPFLAATRNRKASLIGRNETGARFNEYELLSSYPRYRRNISLCIFGCVDELLGCAKGNVRHNAASSNLQPLLWWFFPRFKCVTHFLRFNVRPMREWFSQDSLKRNSLGRKPTFGRRQVQVGDHRCFNGVRPHRNHIRAPQTRMRKYVSKP